MNPASLKSIQVRWFIRRDMDEVFEIENLSFPYPWSMERFLETFRRRNCTGMVAEIDGKVCGFMAYELHGDYLELLNFAVHPSRRRRGIGREMINKMKAKLDQQRRSAISVGVRESNLDGQLFFRAMKFLAVSVLRDCFDVLNGSDEVVKTEDGYLMEFRK